MPDVLWLSTTGLPVGIVRQYDETEKNWKYYIGVGLGVDLDEDVQLILDWGQKYDGLDFLLEFLISGERKLCRRTQERGKIVDGDILGIHDRRNGFFIDIIICPEDIRRDIAIGSIQCGGRIVNTGIAHQR